MVAVMIQRFDTVLLVLMILKPLGFYLNLERLLLGLVFTFFSFFGGRVPSIDIFVRSSRHM